MSGDRDATPGWGFFVSYTATDRPWSEWIAWQLEENGYQVLVQAWDFVPGVDWRRKMDQGVAHATRTIAVVSAAYLISVYGGEEWRAARAADPEGLQRRLLPMRVEDCDLPDELQTVVSVDLFGLTASTTRDRLLTAVRAALLGREKPTVEPEFPLHLGRSSQRRPSTPTSLTADVEDPTIEGGNPAAGSDDVTLPPSNGLP
ncbi:toll/interleukin-1 receptor domain-containing protein, partial [Candidatus Frankia nodulisporulans]